MTTRASRAKQNQTIEQDKKVDISTLTLTLKSEYVCQKCSKTFKTEKMFKRHMTTCLEEPAPSIKQENPVTEPPVKKSRAKKRTLKQLEVCDENDTVNAQSEENKLLLETQSQKKGKVNGTVQCDKCPKEFKSKASLDRHKKVVHTEGSSHCCDVCGARCGDKGTLARHMYVHTGLKPYRCDVCQKQFKRQYHLDRHVNQTGCRGVPIFSFACQVCGKSFSRNDNLKEHLRIHAGETNRKKKHSCEYCKKEFYTPSLLTEHIRTHTGERPFKCDVCGKAFPSERPLKRHIRIHTGERPYECKECGARFTLKETLNRHSRTHSGIRPHKCQFCGKEFSQSSGLKAHLFHHTGENGFSCEQCGKGFNRKAVLQMHIRTVHEKVKPHTCTICNKSFVHREDLTRHSVVHTGIKEFQCPTCNKSFAIKKLLKLHLLTHTREEPKSCSECGRAFIRQDCLLRHVRKRHREMLHTLLLNMEKKVLPVMNTTIDASRPFPKLSLQESIQELLALLVDETALKSFGWPNKAIEELLEAVIRRCGHTPASPEDFSLMDQLRENCKLLFTTVIDNAAVKTLLNNHTVDEVILHVLRLAKTKIL